jgi:hypothetical protein
MQLPCNGTRAILFSYVLFYNNFPFTISLPLPHPFLRYLPHSCLLLILCTLPLSGPFLTAFRVLLALAVVIVIAIATLAPSTSPHTRMRPVPTVINLVDYLIPIQRYNAQEVAGLVLLAPLWLNLNPEIYATVPGDTLAGG